MRIVFHRLEPRFTGEGTFDNPAGALRPTGAALVFLRRNQTMENKLPLECCCCGLYAGRWAQHWNRDSGYGICVDCVAAEAATLSPQDLASCYGKPGVNYAVPKFSHMGRLYTVLAIAMTVEQANAFMERTPGASLLATTQDGRHVLVDSNDLGEPASAQ